MHNSLRLKWYHYVWLTVQLTASLFFIASFGFLLYRYYFMNDGYHDFDSALPSWRMLLAAGFVWLKTAFAFRKRWSELKTSMTWPIAGMMFLGMVVVSVVLLTKYYAQSMLR